MEKYGINGSVGPYRVVQSQNGVRTYYAGRHVNGQEIWNSDHDNAVFYPEVGMATTVMNGLEFKPDRRLNIIRVN